MPFAELSCEMEAISWRETITKLIICCKAYYAVKDPPHCKLWQLGSTNRIIDNSDFKPSNFELQNWSDSKSDDEIGQSSKNEVNF